MNLNFLLEDFLIRSLHKTRRLRTFFVTREPRRTFFVSREPLRTFFAPKEPLRIFFAPREPLRTFFAPREPPQTFFLCPRAARKPQTVYMESSSLGLNFKSNYSLKSVWENLFVFGARRHSRSCTIVAIVCEESRCLQHLYTFHAYCGLLCNSLKNMVMIMTKK